MSLCRNELVAATGSYPLPQPRVMTATNLSPRLPRRPLPFWSRARDAPFNVICLPQSTSLDLPVPGTRTRLPGVDSSLFVLLPNHYAISSARIPKPAFPPGSPTPSPALQPVMEQETLIEAPEVLRGRHELPRATAVSWWHALKS